MPIKTGAGVNCNTIHAFVVGEIVVGEINFPLAYAVPMW